MTITYRKATNADLPALAELRWRQWREDGKVEPEADFAVFSSTFADWCHEQWATNGMSAWLAIQDCHVVGALYVQWVSKVPKPSKSVDRFGYVSGFFVTAENRRRGIGTGLLEQAQADAVMADAEFLLAWPSDGSRPLWYRAGYLDNESVSQELRSYVN